MSFKPVDRQQLQQALNEWCAGPTENIIKKYGNIGGWDVSNVTNMSGMFHSVSAFNQDISEWDVSNVTDMSGMFNGVSVFNHDISRWDVSNVTNMSGMFAYAFAFNQDIDSWTVSKVTDMRSMFFEASNFNQDLWSWEVSKVTDMCSMFFGASAFNGNICYWTVSNVTNMSNMFDGASAFNQDISGWDVSNVTDMKYMFHKATIFNQDIGNWERVINVNDVSTSTSTLANVEDMESMFHDAINFNQAIGNWDVSNVENMSRMFYNASAFNQPLISNWDVSKVEIMSRMFYNVPNMNLTFNILIQKIHKLNNINFQFDELSNNQKKLIVYSIQTSLRKVNEIDDRELIISIEHLSTGGFGHGFKIKTNKYKNFFMKINKDDSSFETNKKEFLIVSKLDHPNIIREIIGIEFDSNSDIQYHHRTMNSQTLEYNYINKPIFKNKFILITELYDNTIDKINKEYWKDPINLIKFIMIILNVFYYFYSKGYSHKDIKQDNIAYYKKKDVVYFKVIDLGGLLPYNTTFHKTNIRYHDDEKKTHNNFSIYTPGYNGDEFIESNIVTDKYDIYSFGKTILTLLYGIRTNGVSNKALNSIFFKKKLTDTYNLSKISYMIKNLIELMIQNGDYYKRPTTFVAIKYLVDIIYILPDNYRKQIKDYLLTNYTINVYNSIKENIVNIHYNKYTFLPKMYQLIAYDFKNRNIKDICKIHLNNIKTRSHSLSHTTLKYLTCNFLDFSDKMINQGFYDPGHTVAQQIIESEIFTKKNLLDITKGKTRENIQILSKDDGLVDKFNTFISNNQFEPLINSTDPDDKKELADKLADYVYKMFNNNQVTYLANISDATSKQIKDIKPENNTILLSDIANNKNGVCRHRAITFKYFCDLAKIQCRLVRGLLYENTDKRAHDIYVDRGIQSPYYHAWNIIKINKNKFLIDIMNPIWKSNGLKNYNNPNLVHKYAIPSLDMFIPLKETYLKQKINHYDLEI